MIERRLLLRTLVRASWLVGATVVCPVAASGADRSLPGSFFLRQVAVKNGELGSALDSASPGDDIVLADGSHGGGYVMRASGTSANPIRVRSANPHQAFLDTMAISGNHVIMEHLKINNFTGGDSIIDITGRDCRVLRNRFINCAVSSGAQRGIVRFGAGADDGVVAYNLFDGFAGNAIKIRAKGPGARRAHIFRNYLKNRPDRGIGIAVGGDVSGSLSDVTRELDALVEWNLLENIEGNQGTTIQFKCSKNIARFNTMRNCPGRLEIRVGNNCQMIANVCLNSRGPVSHGDDHILIGNYNDGGISGKWSDMGPMGGDRTMDDWENGMHPSARNNLYAGNIGVLCLGGGNTAETWPNPASGTIVEAHIGTVITANATATTNRAQTIHIPAYAILQPRDVGPDATS